MQTEVRDAETGERLVLPFLLSSPTLSAALSSADDRRGSRPAFLRRLDHQSPVIHAETQSLRQLGSSVDWKAKQAARVQVRES